MTQSNTQRSSILGAQPYRNPRHAQEAAELEEHEKSLREKQGQAHDTDETKETPDHNWEKRYKDLQSYHARTTNEYENQLKTLQTQKAPELAVPKTPEELEAFRTKNPETFAFIESMVATRVQAQLKDYDQKMASISGDLMETRIEKAMAELKREHPDYEEIVNGDAFHKWAETQDATVQDWIYNNPDKPENASRALALFKYQTGWGSTNANKSNDGGDVSVGNRNAQHNPENVGRNHPAYIWKESEIAKMRPDEFSKWDEHITLAQREGRIAFGQ